LQIGQVNNFIVCDILLQVNGQSASDGVVHHFQVMVFCTLPMRQVTFFTLSLGEIFQNCDDFFLHRWNTQNFCILSSSSIAKCLKQQYANQKHRCKFNMLPANSLFKNVPNKTVSLLNLGSLLEFSWSFLPSIHYFIAIKIVYSTT